VGQDDRLTSHRLDDFARALASPVSRRRAIGAISSVVVAGHLLRAPFARAAGINCPPSGDPTSTKKCSEGGAAVCVQPDWPCCNSPSCAGACPGSWYDCSNPETQAASCDYSPRLCTDPKGPYAGQKLYNFCYEDVVVDGGTCGDRHIKRYGWCCGPGSECGSLGNQCVCKEGHEVCGEKCCGAGEYCETNFPEANTCEKRCPDGSVKCHGVCCTGLETCGFLSFLGCSCKPGYVSCGTGRCCLPKEDPGDPKPGYNPIRDFLGMMGQSSATHGVGKARDVAALPATSGSVAVDAALNALAAVNGQGAAAMLAIRDGKRDPAFKQRVTVARAKPPSLSSGPGLDAGSVAALNRLLVAEARANALIAAMAKALWRERAAHARQDHAAAKRQLRASATFAGQAVTALKRIQALRTAAAKALIAGAVSEVLAPDKSVAAFISTVKSSGIPTYLRIPMGRLGVGSTDLEHLRAGVLGQTVTSASGPVLIAPLQNSARARELRSLIVQLQKFSVRARKHPIAR
jgi:hypothetical protein